MLISPIHTVTAYTADGLDRRTFGWFKTDLGAITAANENRGDMHEMRYAWLVVEEVPPGIHATARVVAWFRWAGASWQACTAPPPWAAGVTNFSLG